MSQYSAPVADSKAQSMRARMEARVYRAQREIVDALREIEPMAFREDTWERPGGGGGTSCVLQEGKIFEKAGVNVSVVYGTLSVEAAARMGGGHHLEGPGHRDFFATGISLVLHPRNPFAPTVHANYRYFERGDGTTPGSWWFGGGADLTPSYLFEDDAQHFHRSLKDVCDRFDAAYYPKFKAWADSYFLIPHREERRGIGGIFFDNLHSDDPEPLFAFVSALADAFVPSYLPILQKRLDTPYEDKHRAWQQIRRGRYVEFNLVYDRGTSFGLRSAGRIESILMSLPLTARFEYDHKPLPGSPEAALLEVTRTPRDWI